MTLDQRGHVTVARPAEQITLPVTGNRSIFNFRRPFANGIPSGTPEQIQQQMQQMQQNNPQF